MNRIAVVGSGGAGKTTLARALADELDLPLAHGDLHRPGWEEVQPGVIAGDRWVIDAMRLGSLDARLARADTAIFVDRSTAACLWGIFARRLLEGRRLQPDGGTGVLSREMLGWVLRFRRRHRPRVLELLERHAADTQVVVLRSRREAEAFLERVRSNHRAA